MQNSKFRKGLVFGIIVLFVGAGVIPSMGGTVVEKKYNHPISNGNILYVGGSGEGNYTKIQDAIDDAYDGDTVFVYDDSSPYNETIIIDKSINLVGENKDTTVIDSNWYGDIININADFVNVSEFTIYNCSDAWVQGAIIINSNYTTIMNNNIIRNAVGITIDGLFSNNIIIGNTITEGVFFGINIYSANNYIIKDNNISTYEFGIRLGNTQNSTVIGNTLLKNIQYGIELYSSSDNNIIYHNNFINDMNANDKCNNIWDNGYPSGGNYWYDYTGKDSDGDGIGDTPYPIPGGDNEDRYPLIYPTINLPPHAPSIDGPISGNPNTEYELSFNTTDPNEDAVMYIIDWGDTSSEWTEYGDSGEEFILKHIWEASGKYTIKAQAIDINGAESDWGEFQVTIPRVKVISSSWLLSFFECFPNTLQFVKYLLRGLYQSIE